jgi:hypothetical protein
MSNGDGPMRKFNFFPTRAAAVCLLAPAVCAESVFPIDNESLVFEYIPSQNITLARKGGMVRGTLMAKDGNIFAPESASGETSLVVQNTGSDRLSFRSAGNITPAEGTVLIEHVHPFNLNTEMKDIRGGKESAKHHYILNSRVTGEGAGLFYELRRDLPEGTIRITAMVSSGRDKWRYFGANMKTADFPWSVLEKKGCRAAYRRKNRGKGNAGKPREVG